MLFSLRYYYFPTVFKDIAIKTNTHIATQSVFSSNCGIFCMKFLIDYNNSKSYKEASNHELKRNHIKKYEVVIKKIRKELNNK